MNKYGERPTDNFANVWQGKENIDGFEPSEKGRKFFVMDIDKVFKGGSQARNFSQYMIKVGERSE